MNKIYSPGLHGEMPEIDAHWNLEEDVTVLVPDVDLNHVSMKMLPDGNVLLTAVGKNTITNRRTETHLVFTPMHIKVLRALLFGPSA